MDGSRHGVLARYHGRSAQNDSATYVPRWTISALAVFGTIVAAWVLGI